MKLRGPHDGHPALRRLEAIRGELGAATGREKRALLRALERTRLASPDEVLRLHEVALWLLAYPDDAGVRRAAEQLLARFADRPDLRRDRAALIDTGVAGTVITYRLFWPLARWLAEVAPDRLSFDWDAFEDTGPLLRWLPRLLPPGERAALLRDPRPARQQLQDRAGGAADATFFLRQLLSLDAEERVLEAIHDDFDHPYRLEPGPRPSRTLGRLQPARIYPRQGPLHAGRPDLAASLARRTAPPKDVPRAKAEELIGLAKEAMVTRSRDLEVFGFGHDRDVAWIDDGEGLAFAAIGFRPDRRLLFHGTYGLLTLKNGVPIGYVQVDGLLGNAELSFNTFPTFRGGESAWIFARTLAACQALFRSRSFSIEPYQLGDHNEEAILSGAWWFYQKLGFRPLDRDNRARMSRELSKMAKDPSYRSPPTTLRRLATTHLVWSPARGARLGHLPIDRLSAAVSRWLTEAAPSRAEAEDQAMLALDALTGRRRALNAAEAREWRRWAPIVACLPGTSRMSREERRGLEDVVRAKAGRTERDFVRAFDGHRALCASFEAWIKGRSAGPRSRGRGRRAR